MRKTPKPLPNWCSDFSGAEVVGGFYRFGQVPTVSRAMRQGYGGKL